MEHMCVGENRYDGKKTAAKKRECKDNDGCAKDERERQQSADSQVSSLRLLMMYTVIYVCFCVAKRCWDVVVVVARTKLLRKR